MSKLTVSLGCCDYDRTRALFDGRTAIKGCDVICDPIEPEEAFHRAFKFQEFDISELSLSSHMMTTSRGENEYVGVPAFVSRLFRHSGIYIRTDRGIENPKDLAGKTIGLPEYQITANVWIRGLLQDDYGVKPSDIHWRSGGLEDPGREERSPLSLPPEIDLQPVPADRSLSEMLASGELDAVIGARAPSPYLQGAANIDRMFPNFRDVERDYFTRTGIFPIMHIIGIRKSIAEAHPWLAVNVYNAFVEAKRLCMAELAQIGHLYTSLPWGVADFQDAQALMGEDYWRYGIGENRTELDALCRYSFEQGLSARQLSPEDLFAEPVRELFKI